MGSRHSVLDPDDPRGGPNSIGTRVDQAKKFWADGGWMNPSEASMNSQGQFDWGDGRHRMVAASQLGEIYSPVLMYTSDMEQFRQSGIRTIRA
jgi:hypothetical protein